MTGPHEVYISDGHGTLTKLTPRLAAEALSDFWEGYGIERHHMSWQNNSGSHPGSDMDGKRCRIYMTGSDRPIDGKVQLRNAPFVQVTERIQGLPPINLNALNINHWTEIDDED